MSGLREECQVLYEISLAIETCETLQETVAQAMTCYLQKLDCTAGGVFEHVAGSHRSGYEPVYTVPDDPSQNDALQIAAGLLSVDGNGGQGVRASLPESGPVDDSHYHVMELPGFGVLILVTSDGPFDESALSALKPLNEKLANACENNRAEQRIRNDRNRFEAVFETTPEPIANVVLSDQKPVVKRINSAFEETFAITEREARGRNLNEMIVPDIDEIRERAQRIYDTARQDVSIAMEIRRDTPDGVRDFLFRTADAAGSSDEEQFWMFIDISERKERERKLETLYDATYGMLAEERSVQICEEAVTAADENLDLSIAGIHRHDRATEALVPVATTSKVTEVFEGDPDAYTDTDSVVWDVYRSGEAVQIDDTERFDGELPNEETPVRSVIILPIENFGVFIGSSTDSNAFDESDFYFARLLATMVETALRRAEREHGLEGIQQLTRAGLQAETRQEISETTIERIPGILGFPGSAIWTYDETTQELEVLAATDSAREIHTDFPEFGANLAMQVAQQGETVYVDDVAARMNGSPSGIRLGSVFAVPIGEFGILVAGSTMTGDFSTVERYLLETFGTNLETVFELVTRRRDIELLDQVLARVLRHNIRNDLTKIQIPAEIIAEECRGTLEENAETIVSVSEELDKTAEAAHEMRHIVQRRDQRATVSFPDILVSVVRSIEEEYPTAEIETTFEASVDLRVHPDFETAVYHLVENGIEHNDATDGTAPRVAISLTRCDGALVLEIEDDGPGIPPNELDILDQHGESALAHGSGIGLWIVDRVVAYSNAQIEFEASPNGTTATILFE